MCPADTCVRRWLLLGVGGMYIFLKNMRRGTSSFNSISRSAVYLGRSPPRWLHKYHDVLLFPPATNHHGVRRRLYKYHLIIIIFFFFFFFCEYFQLFFSGCGIKIRRATGTEEEEARREFWAWLRRKKERKKEKRGYDSQFGLKKRLSMPIYI